VFLGDHCILNPKLKHVLALTNAGNATATEIAELAKSAQKSVYEKFGITLVAEVNLIGLEL
jgi:UDP-N-acetylmuramate dehydrogenase